MCFCSLEVQCQATKADIVFVVDSSGSIGNENFDKLRQFLEAMINRLDVDPDLTRVGLMLFSDKITWQFKIEEQLTKESILKVHFYPYKSLLIDFC